MQSIYLDNASTSFPKAPGVSAAMVHYLDEVGVNVSRGGYSAALSAEETTLSLREALCRMFHSSDVESCILTSGATYGLNMVLKGLLRPGDHVVVSSMEHNAVMRPLHQLEGVVVDVLQCNADGTLQPEKLLDLLCPDTRLVCVTHASNVCGTVLPITVLGHLCHEHNIPFVVDASQTAGHLPIDCQTMHIDGLIFSAHKGLLGPQGMGAALLTRRLAQALSPFVTGGTGSRSDQVEQPHFLPDKLEAGTPNLPGIYGFLTAVAFMEEHGQELMQQEAELCAFFWEGLRDIPKVRLVGLPHAEGRVGVFSLIFPEQDQADAALALEKSYGIMTRCGLHCAPCAHQTLGTFPEGTIRFSLGWKNTRRELETALSAIRELAR